MIRKIYAQTQRRRIWPLKKLYPQKITSGPFSRHYRHNLFHFSNAKGNDKKNKVFENQSVAYSAKGQMPLRDFIYDRLYHPEQGYFCKADYQLGELKQPIKFKTLIGFDDYQKELAEKYPKNAWLTPCQVFKPYYGMAVANYIKTAHEVHLENCFKNKRQSVPEKIRIVEAGAGTGSAAESVLYFFKNYEPQLYQNLEYTIVQISPILCKRIEDKIRKSFPQLLENKQIKIINKDIAQYKTKELCYLMFFEVLDNMPHDKVLYDEESRSYKDFVTVDVETMVENKRPIKDDELVRQTLEIYQELQAVQNKNSQRKHREEDLLLNKLPFWDRLAQKLARYLFKMKAQSSKDIFLPTYFCKYLKNSNQNVPNAHFILSDFDELFTAVPGKSAPIVSTKLEKSFQKKDFSTYLVKRGEADIFFPIDFPLVSHMYKRICRKEGKYLKTYQFMDEFSEPEWALTKSNFNPIKQDFGNTSFFVTNVKRAKK